MSRANTENVARVIGKIYEAAYDQEVWRDTVSELCTLFDGSRACIVRFDGQDCQAVASVHDPEFASKEAVDALLRSPLKDAFFAVPEGVIYQPYKMIDEAEFRRGEVWNDWCEPRDMYDGIAYKLPSSGGGHWLFDVQRGRNQAPMGQPEIALLEFLAPHLLRAGQIGKRIGGALALASTFEHLPYGLLLVDKEGRVGTINEAADALLRRPYCPMRYRDGHIFTLDRQAEKILPALIAEACSLHGDAAPGLGGDLRIRSQHPGGTDLVVSVAPILNARTYGVQVPHSVAILVREIRLDLPEGFERHVCRVFDLTLAEARLAAALASGRTLRGAAEDAGLSFSTVRTYLDRIFRKTGTNQQSQLVALLKTTQPLGPLQADNPGPLPRK